ncbi:MAG: isoamylase early set domain-containing protein [Melioribacteraceae bacterium]|nr:isoamylase early set domain-containing protein [Melioribacteraceae bacterium]
MAIKKQFLKTKDICKVTFKIPMEIGKEFETASVVGDFNNWDHNVHIMKKLKKDGSFSIVITLEKGKEYQFRYLLDGEHWANDNEADKHYTTHFGDSENSVLEL